MGPGRRASSTSFAILGASLFLQPALDRAEEPPMARVPSGVFKPLFKEDLAHQDRAKAGSSKSQEAPRPIPVEAFDLDTYPVTQSDYEKFVRANPAWRRSKTKRIFADSNYLKNWKNDLSRGEVRTARSPVTYISWFAAKAYCEWKGKELPTVAEWEYAAAIPENDPEAQAAYKKLLLEWYGMPTAENIPSVGSTFRNRYGIYDLHGLIWEWTSDFNSALVMQDARGDGGRDANLFCGGGAAGATDFRDYAGFMRYAFRNSLQGNYTVANLGFRCKRSLLSTEKKESRP